MKITVIKKGTANAKPSNWCPTMIDDQPLGKSAKPSNMCPTMIDY